MNRDSGLIDCLKRVLKARGITYAVLAERLGLSEAGIKRAFAKGAFTLSRLEEICRVAGITLFELVKTAELEAQGKPLLLSEAQELALAADESLFAYLYLLRAGHRPRDIVEAYRFTAAESSRCLAVLDRLGLIEWDVGDRVRVPHVGDPVWRPDGPLALRYLQEAKQEFVGGDFRGEHAFLKACHADLSPSSVAVLRRKLEALAREFEQLAAMDRLSDDGERERIWLLAAFRPWVFSYLEKYQKTESP